VYLPAAARRKHELESYKHGRLNPPPG
jgi:hypothetical protein